MCGLPATDRPPSRKPSLFVQNSSCWISALPGMDGYEVACQIRKQGLHDTVIIAVSGHGRKKTSAAQTCPASITIYSSLPMPKSS